MKRDDKRIAFGIFLAGISAVLLMVSNGCAGVPMNKASLGNDVGAIVVFAQAFDEIFGCPLDISRKTGREPTEESCRQN